MQKAPGLVEFRDQRGLMAPAQIRTTTVWQSMPDWANCTEGTLAADGGRNARLGDTSRVGALGAVAVTHVS